MNPTDRLLGLLILTGVVGCGSGVVERTGGDQGGANLLALNNFYMKATESLKRAPQNLNELKAQSKEIGDISKVLTSPNDNEPYVIIWGTNPLAAHGTQGAVSVVLAYEKTGAGGFRWVLTTSGVDKLSRAQFRTANFPVGHTPGTGK